MSSSRNMLLFCRERPGVFLWEDELLCKKRTGSRCVKLPAFCSLQKLQKEDNLDWGNGLGCYLLILQAFQEGRKNNFQEGWSWFFFFFYIYLTVLGLSCGMWDLIPWLGIEPRAPALGVWSLSQWTTREVPKLILFLLNLPLFFLILL